MDKAKQAVSDFIHKAGHHDTTVHETVAPAVTRETVKPTVHEGVQKAIDREVHQDHYHTTVQPVQDREVLPEKHRHNVLPVEHREHHHGNKEDVARRLEQGAAQYMDESVTAKTKHTSAEAPTVVGEHIHHHVHETIQPVIHRETIQPEVIHTTVPVHEVHHHEAKHHAHTALPAVSMQDFKSQGGTLSGRGERYDGFEGEPKPVGATLAGHHHHTGHQHGVAGSNTEGATAGGVAGSRGMTGTGRLGEGTTTTASGTTGAHHATGKPSLLQKLNPLTDTDGDGKRGVGE